MPRIRNEPLQDWKDLPFETELSRCEVEGEIPAELRGTFYRIGGEWVFPPRFEDDAPFAADGIASMFRIANGSCDFRARFVRTPRFLANSKARRQLFGYYRNPFTDDPEVSGLSATVANTNIILHAGRLLALKEDTLPYELDPETLETRGPFDFDGGYKATTFTAHPKHDSATGELVTFGYEAEGLASNAIWFYTIDAQGHVTSERKLQAPYVSMVHDIAISQNYIVIPVFGMVTSMDRLKEGKIHWGWDRSLPSYLGVLPRHGEATEIRWFEGGQMAMVHTFGASDEDGAITLHAAVSDSNPFPFFPDIGGAAFDGQGAQTTIRRYRIDMNSQSECWAEERLFPGISGALCRIDDRFTGRPYRYGFLGYTDPTKPFDGKVGGFTGTPVNCYGRFDFETGQVETMFAGSSLELAEVCFAPRSADAPEGVGWVLGLARDNARELSELVIADSANLAAGPVARVKLPFMAPGQVHANWVPEWEHPV